MEAHIIRKKFLEYFGAHGHAIVPSSSLIPDDPSVLLTTAGMQQFKKYYTGEADPYTTIHPLLRAPLGHPNAVSVQKSFRTSDIDEVGDETHLTFFQMLGNFSFGGYFKKEAIAMAHEFMTKTLGLEISYVTIFRGNDQVPKDEESRMLWNAHGVTDIREEGVEDVFWGPTGTSGPCGPTTEIYCKNGRGNDVEIWNIVFNEFFFPGSREELLSGASGKKLERMQTPGVDTGMGLERLSMIAQKTGTIFETDLFAPFIELLPVELSDRQKCIIIDHVRAAAFLLADGVRPSNKGAGYILRRLIRRASVYEHLNNIPVHVFDAILHDIVHEYGEFYSELLCENEAIRTEFLAERKKFGNTMTQGIKAFSAIALARENGAHGESLSGEEAFNLYQSFGFPREVMRDLCRDNSIAFDDAGFEEAVKHHQEISRAGQEKKFGGHGLLLDTGELKAADERELAIVTRLHTATHLLHAALRKVLGPDVRQDGSDITVERTRFDFTFPRKMTPEEIAEVERLVNGAIAGDFQVTKKDMAYEDALRSGALHFFKEKYPAEVHVYTIADPKSGEVFSKEFCGGPHVAHTGEIGAFRIAKEESSSAGVRRIRGVVSGS